MFRIVPSGNVLVFSKRIHLLGTMGRKYQLDPPLDTMQNYVGILKLITKTEVTLIS